MSAGLLQINLATRSFAGSREVNEDAVASDQFDGHWCCVVCDGAGGHADGATASRVASERTIVGFRARPAADQRDLCELIMDAHDAVLEAQKRSTARGHPMQSTIVALAIDQNRGHAIWGHVGDSRLYVLRRGRVLEVTRDDSVVQWMVDSGYLPAELARDNPKKNQLLAALGTDTELEPSVCNAPLALEDGDAFLLCTDGWWDRVSKDDIEHAFAISSTAEDWLDRMARLVADRAEPNQDNFTALGVWIGDPSQLTLIAQPAARAS